jgi:general secretion pathway protein F
MTRLVSIRDLSKAARRTRMTTASLDDFMAVNEQLAALIEAGVPLDVGHSQRETSSAKMLERINATIVRRVSRGETLVEALEGDDEDVPGAYRSMLQLGLRTGNLSAALDGSGRVAESVDESRFALESAIVYPLVVCLLAYLGLIGFSLYLAPTLEGFREEGQNPAGPGLRVLQGLRHTLVYWAPIPPILVAALLAGWLRSKSRRATTGESRGRLLGWLPGVSQIVFQQRAARFAGSLAELLDSQVPLREALVIAGDSSGAANLMEGAKLLAAAVQDGPLPDDDGPIALRFPPFLRWALWHSDTSTGRVRALQIAARMYSEASQRRGERLQTFAPMVALVLLAGTVTLLYGLALFVPVVEMLVELAA